MYCSELLLSRAFILPRKIKILHRYLCKKYLCFTDGVCETDSGDLFSSFTSKECQSSNAGCVIIRCMIFIKLDLTLKLVLLWMRGWTKWPSDISSNLVVFYDSNLLCIFQLSSLNIQITVQTSNPRYNILLGSTQSQCLIRSLVGHRILNSKIWSWAFEPHSVCGMII